MAQRLMLWLETAVTILLGREPYVRRAPVQSEASKKIADGYNRTRLTPTIKRVFTTWLSWARR